MNRFIQAFMDLYNCDNPVKRHLLIMLLLLCPAILVGLIFCIDDSLPKEILIGIFILSILVALISIIPVIIATGTFLDFIKSRLNGEKGVPVVNWGQFITGIKILPIFIVWSLYFFIGFIIVFLLPNILGVFCAVKISSNISSIITFCLLIGYDILAYISCFVTVAFFFYIVCEYVEAGTYKARFFNPLLIFKYMKKFFIPTMKALVYYIITSLGVGVVSSIIYILLILFVFAMLMVLFLIDSSNNFEYLLRQPNSLFLILLVLCVRYLKIMLYATYADLLTKVYVEDKKQ